MTALDVQIDVWLTEFENKAAEEEKEFDDKEEQEDNRLTSKTYLILIFYNRKNSIR